MIFPTSRPVLVGTNGHIYEGLYQGAGSTRDDQFGIGVTDGTTLTADVIAHLRFQMPQTLPSGTATLYVRARANAATGAAKWNPKWVSVASGEDPSSATLNAEGTQTLTWSTGDADDYKLGSVALDADTVVAGEVIHIDFTFEDTSWTLAVDSIWDIWIDWA